MKKFLIILAAVTVFYGCKSTSYHATIFAENDKDTDSNLSENDEDVDSNISKTDEDVDSDISEIETLILDAINKFRQSYSLPALKKNKALSCAARLHSKDQAKRKSIGNWGFSNGERNTQLRSCGADNSEIDFLTVENVAIYPKSSSNETVANAFVYMWKNDTKSKVIILDKNSSFIGVGVAESGSDYYATYIYGK